MKIFIGLLISALFAFTILFGLPTKAENQQFGENSFTVYEAYIHPAQELGPATGSQAKGYGRIRFAQNLSSGRVDVQMSGIDPANLTAFHIHCGTPDVLGPIIVNFAQFGEFKKTVVNGQFSASITNDKLTFVKQPLPPPSLSSAPTLPLPEGCPSDLNIPVQVHTIAGLEALARKGVLYFNVHTKGHEFYGEMRGQLYPVEK